MPAKGDRPAGIFVWRSRLGRITVIAVITSSFSGTQQSRTPHSMTLVPAAEATSAAYGWRAAVCALWFNALARNHDPGHQRRAAVPLRGYPGSLTRVPAASQARTRHLPPGGVGHRRRMAGLRPGRRSPPDGPARGSAGGGDRGRQRFRSCEVGSVSVPVRRPVPVPRRQRFQRCRPVDRAGGQRIALPPGLKRPGKPAIGRDQALIRPRWRKR